MSPMQRDAVATAEVDAAVEPDFNDSGDVDLSFAGPEPVAAAPWPLRVLDVATAYLPLLLMAGLAGLTWWLVRSGPSGEAGKGATPPRHEADYVMTNFVVKRFATDGSLRTEIEGSAMRHYPDNDTVEVDAARIRAHGAGGVVTVATATRALANGDGSEVQLMGDARIVRPAVDKQRPIEFSGEFFAAFRNLEQVRSHLPVVVTQGGSVVRAEGMLYDNLSRVVELKGKVGATFATRAPAH